MLILHPDKHGQCSERVRAYLEGCAKGVVAAGKKLGAELKEMHQVEGLGSIADVSRTWRLVRNQQEQVEEEEAPAATATDGGLPAGWECTEHQEPGSAPYKRYRGPNGERAQSRTQAWALHQKARREARAVSCRRSVI